MKFLKQSTDVTLKFGPFLDEIDGITEETALTILQSDIRLSKNGNDITQKADTTTCTHDELGIYNCSLNTTDTDTLGILQFWVHKSGALPIWYEFMVITAEAFDTFCATDHWTVDLVVPMRGTDGANTTIPPTMSQIDSQLSGTHGTNSWEGGGAAPTVGEIRTEMEGVGTKLSEVLTDTTGLNGDPMRGTDGANTDKTGYSLSPSAIDAILDEPVEGTYTMREMLRLMGAVLCGKSSGGGTATITFRDIVDSKDRVVADVTNVGDRTSITLTQD